MTYTVAMVAQKGGGREIDAGADPRRRGREGAGCRPRSPTWTRSRRRASAGRRGGRTTASSRRYAPRPSARWTRRCGTPATSTSTSSTGAPHSSAETQAACQAADMVVIPTSEGLDDLQPAVILANNLLKNGIPAHKVAFALCITSDSAREVAAARAYLGETAYTVLDGDIPFRAAFKTAMDQGKGGHRDVVSDAAQARRRHGAEHHRRGGGKRREGGGVMADLARLKPRARPQGNAAASRRDQLEPGAAAARQAGPQGEDRVLGARIHPRRLRQGGRRALRLPERLEVGPVHRHVGRVPGAEDRIAG